MHTRRSAYFDTDMHSACARDLMCLRKCVCNPRHHCMAPCSTTDVRMGAGAYVPISRCVCVCVCVCMCMGAFECGTRRVLQCVYMCIRVSVSDNMCVCLYGVCVDNNHQSCHNCIYIVDLYLRITSRCMHTRPQSHIHNHTHICTHHPSLSNRHIISYTQTVRDICIHTPPPPLSIHITM